MNLTSYFFENTTSSTGKQAQIFCRILCRYDKTRRIYAPEKQFDGRFVETVRQIQLVKKVWNFFDFAYPPSILAQPKYCGKAQKRAFRGGLSD